MFLDQPNPETPSSEFLGNAHTGLRPSRWRALARTTAMVSLSSTSASRSSRSPGVRRPSLLRSIKSCSRRSARDGRRRAATDSTMSSGAEITADIDLSSLVVYGVIVTLRMLAWNRETRVVLGPDQTPPWGTVNYASATNDDVVESCEPSASALGEEDRA